MDKKIDPDLIYGVDGEPMMCNGRPMRQSTYDDHTPGFLQFIKDDMAKDAQAKVVRAIKMDTKPKA